MFSLTNFTTLDCYFHNISPVKTASTSSKKYLNCVVQCSDKSVRAVCYSPEKRAELHALVSTRRPVKLDNYKRPNNRDDDFVITKFTKVVPIDKKEINFSFLEELTTTATGKPLNISAIQKVAAEQLISLKAKVVSL